MSTCLLQLRQKRFIGLRTKVAIKYSGKILKLKNDKAVKEMAVCQWCFIFQIRKFTNSCPPSQDMNLALVSTSARSPVYMFDICKSLLREANKLKGYPYMWVYLLPECYWEFCILQLTAYHPVCLLFQCQGVNYIGEMGHVFQRCVTESAGGTNRVICAAMTNLEYFG